MSIYEEQLKRAERARQLAAALSQSKSPDGSMVSGHYVSPGWAKQLAYGIDQYQGAKGLSEADLMEQNASVEKQKAVEDWMGSMPQNTPERQAPTFNSGTSQLLANALKGGVPSAEMPIPQQTGSQTIPASVATPEQRLAWIMKGQQIDPAAAGLGAKYMEMEQAREAAKQASIEKAQERRDTQQAQFGQQREMANLVASLRPAPADKIITVMDESGTPFSIPQSQFQQGMTLYNPSTAANLKAAKDKGNAKKGLSDTVDELAAKYQALKEGGGIVSTENGWLQNAGARVSQSAVGDFAGGVLGTENATNRAEIEMMRPMLMQSLKGALGMTAAQMNSDADIRLAMLMTSNPSKYSFEANIAQLDKIDKKYGLNMGLAEKFGIPSTVSTGKVTQSAIPPGWSVQEQ